LTAAVASIDLSAWKFISRPRPNVKDLASTSGRTTDDLVEGALAGYLEEATQMQQMLDSRYDEIKTGVKPIDVGAFFDSLRHREGELTGPAWTTICQGVDPCRDLFRFPQVGQKDHGLVALLTEPLGIPTLWAIWSAVAKPIP
jgi:hypothetical protein